MLNIILKRNRLLLLQICFLLFASLQCFCQQRKDEEIPKNFGQTKSISNLTGWAKNDIGKWYKFNLFQRGQEILKIETSTVRYEDKDYLCVAVFEKSFFIRYNVKHTQYSAFFWVLDTTQIEDVDYSDTAVHTRVFGNIFVSNVIGNSSPVTWNNLLFELKRCFIGTSTNKSTYKDRFFIKYRYDYKLNKTQFYIGSFIDFVAETTGGKESKDEYEFTELALILPFGPGECQDKNRNLECIYFEVPKNLFDNIFKRILWD